MTYGQSGGTCVDAVVIGGGHNGLVAAVELADQGWDVLVCEAKGQPGGAVRSAPFVAPDFESDLFSSFYPLGAASPVFAALALEDHGLRWCHAPLVLSHVLPDDRVVSMSRDLDQTMQSVAAFAPSDARAWQELFTEWRRIEQQLVRTLFAPLPAIRPVVALARTLGLAGSARLARTALLPMRRFAEETFAGAGAPLLLAGNALHADLSPDGACSAVYGWLLAMLGQSVGFPVPQGGSSALTRALACRLESAGGQLRLNARVDDIVVVDGVARGVRLTTGESISARRAVIADLPAPPLFRDLVGFDNLPGGFVRDLARFQWDAPTLKINWALRRRIPWSNPEAAGGGTVHLGVDLDGMTTYAADLALRRCPQQPFVVLGQMTTADPTRSPAGTEAAWAYTHLPDGARHDEAEVDLQVRRVEQTIERHAPGFADTIAARVVQSPMQLERENPALVGGAINGGTAQVHQQLVFRPAPGFGNATTPVDRLYLGSSSAHPGGGVHGGPGHNAARAALARDGVRGRAARRVRNAVEARLYAERSEQSAERVTA